MVPSFPLPNDGVLPGLRFLMDESRVRELALSAGAREVAKSQPVYLRWKPCTCACVLHRLTPKHGHYCLPFALVQTESDGKGMIPFEKTGQGAFNPAAPAHFLLSLTGFSSGFSRERARARSQRSLCSHAGIQHACSHCLPQAKVRALQAAPKDMEH